MAIFLEKGKGQTNEYSKPHYDIEDIIDPDIHVDHASRF